MLIQYRVQLETISPESEYTDIQYSTLVEASSESEAIEIAKIRQNSENPELHQSQTWSWSVYLTAEKIEREEKFSNL